MSAGSAPLDRICEKADSSPRSAISTLRMPCSAARGDVLEALHDLLLAARGGGQHRAGRCGGGGRGVPAGVRPREQRHLDARLAGHAGHVVELAVGEHEHAAALRHAVHRHVRAASRSPAPRAGSRGPRCWGSRSGSARRRRSAAASRAARAGRRAAGPSAPGRLGSRSSCSSYWASRNRTSRSTSDRSNSGPSMPATSSVTPAFTKSSRRSAWAAWTRHRALDLGRVAAELLAPLVEDGVRLAPTPRARRSRARWRRARRSGAASPWGRGRRS